MIALAPVLGEAGKLSGAFAAKPGYPHPAKVGVG